MTVTIVLTSFSSSSFFPSGPCTFLVFYSAPVQPQAEQRVYQKRISNEEVAQSQHHPEDDSHQTQVVSVDRQIFAVLQKV